MALLLLILLIVQYFAAKTSLNTLVVVLDRFLPRSIVFAIISLLFFPGTVVHELAHAITALCLFLPVHSIHLIPEWDHHSIKLGHVAYEKRGLWRSIVVGLAPLPVALAVVWWILQAHLPLVLTGYLMFVITSTMFSSKSDLVDAIYIIPLAIVAGLIWLAFPQVIEGILQQILENKGFISTLNTYLNTMNMYVIFSLCLHLIIIGLGKLLSAVFGRN